MAQQTPKRQAPKKPTTSAKKALSPEEKRILNQKKREQERLRREEAARLRQLRRQRRKKLFLISSVLALVFVVFYYGYVALSILLRPDGSEDALPLMVFTQGELEEDTAFEPQEVTFNGGTYLPVTVLEPYMAISQFGDYETRSFLLCDSGEYATFYLGTCNAVVNGEKVFLENRVFLKDEMLYIPVDFFEDKMNCFDYTHSSALAANVLTYLEGVDPGFRFSPSSENQPVDVATVPVAPTVPGTQTQPAAGV